MFEFLWNNRNNLTMVYTIMTLQCNILNLVTQSKKNNNTQTKDVAKQNVSTPELFDFESYIATYKM